MLSPILRVVITFDGERQEEFEAAVVEAGIDTFESSPEPAARGWVALYIEGHQVDETLARLNVPFSGYDVRVEPAAPWPTFQGPAEPVSVGEFTMVAPWFAGALPGQRLIHLDPGLSFGTGTHPTTAMMLEWLSELHPATLLDAGCGSGILSIAAGLLGAKVTALDIDEEAVRAAAANKLRNEANFELIHGPVSAVKGRFDCIAANLLAVTIVELWGQLFDRLAPGGSLLVSGILEEQENDLLNKIPASPLEVRRRDGWTGMRFRRELA